MFLTQQFSVDVLWGCNLFCQIIFHRRGCTLFFHISYLSLRRGAGLIAREPTRGVLVVTVGDTFRPVASQRPHRSQTVHEEARTRYELSYVRRNVTKVLCERKNTRSPNSIRLEHRNLLPSNLSCPLELSRGSRGEGVWGLGVRISHQIGREWGWGVRGGETRGSPSGAPNTKHGDDADSCFLINLGIPFI